MALYALGDLHLSFQADKPMDSFGKVWKNHEKKIEKYANRMVKPEDTLGFSRKTAGTEDPPAGKSRSVLGRQENREA